MPTRPIDVVLHKLPSAQRRGSGWVAKCPGHRDRMPSLKVDVDASGKVLLYCHAGCDTPKVVTAMGLRLSDLMPEDGPAFDPFKAGHVPAGGRPSLRVVGNTALKASSEVAAYFEEDPAGVVAQKANPQAWPVVKRYPYVDADGVLLFEVLRKEAPDGSGKVFTQEQPDGTRGLKGIDARPLYRLPAVLTAVEHGTPILLVEGEKDVETAETLGWVATTNVGGASGWKPEHVHALVNADVVLLPDNDEPGRKWAQTVADSLVGFAKRIRIVALPRVERKGDLTDWVAMGGTSTGLSGLVLKAKDWRAGDPIPEQERPSKFRVYRADELVALPPASWLVDGMLPTDALAALVGPSGKGKTFLTIGLACAVATGSEWMGQPVEQAGPVLYIAAEGTAGLRQRVQAWVAHHGAPPDLPLYFICETVNFLEDGDVAEVMRAMAALPQPPRLIIVDTLHRAMPGGDENSAKDVGLVVTHADELRRESGATVLIVHHSKKDADVERGSTALRGACDTLLMLRDDEGTKSLHCDKQKDAQDFTPITLDLVATHGSCVVEVVKAGEETERIADPMQLKPNERIALKALEDAAVGAGLTSTEWEKVSSIASRSFYRVKAALVRAELVTEGGRGGRFQVSAAGRAALSYCQSTANVTAKLLPKDGEKTTKPGGYRAPLKGGSNIPSPVVGSGSGSGSNVGEFRRGPQTRAVRPTSGGRSGRDAAADPPEWVTEWRDFDAAEIPA